MDEPTTVMNDTTEMKTTKLQRKIFGTDGVRGKANVHPMTPDIALALGRASAHVLLSLGGGGALTGRPTIVVGKDTRVSGYMLENALTAGILSMGVDATLLGPLPTPGVAYVTRSLRAHAGIMITASHNPYYDNGIKFFRHDGHKLDDDVEERIEHLVFSGEIESVRPTAGSIGKARRIEDALGRYIEYAKSTMARGFTLDGLRIVVDCANGAAYKSSPCVLRELGAEVIAVGIEPDGTNINAECGSMFPAFLAQKVREFRADVGIAHDGDADRVVMCDPMGNLIDGDDILAVSALEMLRLGTLAKKTLVATVMSNSGLDAAVRAAGGEVIRTQVGDRYVMDLMVREGYNLGGEQSGHIIYGDHATTGDGLVAALKMLEAMKRTDKPLSELVKCWQKLPQTVVNILVREKRQFEELDGVMDLVREAEAAVAPGRVFLRYSGTEPKARLLIEGLDTAANRHWAHRIEMAIRAQIAA